MDKYTYRVSWSEEDGEYVGQCLEFPSLSWLDDSQVKALEGIQQVVSDVIEDMVAEGECPPVPLSKKRYSGKFQVRVAPELHRELAYTAAEQKVSLNRLVSNRLASPC